MIFFIFPGFTVVKDLTDFVSSPTAKPTSPSIWSDKASDEFSPAASSSIVDEQIEKSYATKEQMNGSAYDHSEEGSTRSPRSSSGRSTFESPFNSVQFGTHDMSPSSKGRHRYTSLFTIILLNATWNILMSNLNI